MLNSAIFLVFAFTFTKPKTKRDWRSFSAFSAFIVALFVEMYDVPRALESLHVLSNLLIVAGFFLLAAAWRVLYKAQRAGRLATDGPDLQLQETSLTYDRANPRSRCDVLRKSPCPAF